MSVRRVVKFDVFYVIMCFFKQKTAYEMGISDWSSDVCSSDLSGRQIAPGLECPDRINGAIDKNDQRRPDRETVAMLRPPEMKRHKHQPAHQIGRASCRERVCQYV